MALTSTQKRKAREALARKRGVSASSISDTALQQAIASSVITSSDYGSGSGGSGGYSGGSDGGASASVDCGGGF